MNGRIVEIVNELSELKLVGGITSIPHLEEFFDITRTPSAKSAFAKKHNIKGGFVVNWARKRNLDHEQTARKKFLSKLQKFVDELSIEHAGVKPDWSEWMPPGDVADKLGLTLKQFNKAVEDGHYEVNYVSQKLCRIRRDTLSAEEHKLFTSSD